MKLTHIEYDSSLSMPLTSEVQESTETEPTCQTKKKSILQIIDVSDKLLYDEIKEEY